VRGRGWILVFAVIAAAAVAVPLLATRSSDGANAVSTPSPRVIRAALISRLDAQHLTYRWVVCVPTGRVFHDRGVIRCNVNFGDPHIEAYCAIIERDRLVTDHERSGFGCPPDLRGWTTTVVTGP
jgi:hypothetical protein